MARVPIGLKVSKADAARIDEVLTRPEFAGWTRADWCLEIVRSALRYYVGDGPAPGPGKEPVSGRPAAAQPVPSSEAPAPPPAGAPIAAGGASASAAGPAAGAARPVLPAAGEASPDGLEVPEHPARAECPHPPEARNYETGSCAACGAVLWD